MPNIKQIPGPENKSFVSRAIGGAFLKTARTAISTIKPGDWMSALQPLIPWLPMVLGRQWDFPVGKNINYTPRGGDKITFNMLRSFASKSEVARMVIENQKDKLCSQPWQIKAKEGHEVDEEDPRIQKWTKFFKRPDGDTRWSDWLRTLAEELFVTDAVTMWRAPNRVMGLHGLFLLDGATIFPLIDDSGRRPAPPNPAYQQILKGVPKGNYTSDEMIYAPRNVRVYTRYGRSNIEQCIQTLQQDIARSESQLLYFTAGSVPDAYMVMGEGIPNDQVKAFGTYLNDLLTGNLAGKRQVPVAPFGTKIEQLKEQVLKDDFDEWVARKICAVFHTSPTPFVRQLNRSTAETSSSDAKEEGLGPIMDWICELLEGVMAHEGDDDLEFVFLDDKELDQTAQSAILVAQVHEGIITRNEARDTLGLDPIKEDAADQLMVTTGTGLMPLPGSDLDQQMQEQKLSQQVEINQSKPAPTAQPGAAGGKPAPKGGKKPVGKRAGSHKPLTFRYSAHHRISVRPRGRS